MKNRKNRTVFARDSKSMFFAPNGLFQLQKVKNGYDYFWTR
jgi:hypothetical protein